ncbi:MAG TPA: ABC transporter permease [Vicinamibacteria bacterium]|nr:ABC transporter permease [Vicinamibacteria bacterium]
MARVRALLRNLLRRQAVERDLDEELRAYLDAAAEAGAEAGLDAPGARRAAAVEMGSLEAVKESVRDIRAGATVEALWRDAAMALRQVRRQPLFALAVILTLGLAIGANTAVFSVVRAVLLEPLPYGDPARLHMIWSNSDRAGYLRAPLSGPELNDLREQATLYRDFAAIWSTTAQITGDGPPEQLRVALVTSNFFTLLDVPPALGRGFEAGEEGPGAPNVAVLSDAFWRRRFGADPRVVGRQLRIDGGSVTVVGIASPGLRLWLPTDANVPSDPQLIAPFPFDLRANRALYYLRTLGRLREDVQPDSALQQVAALGRRLEAQHTEYAASGRSLFAVPLSEDAAREVRPILAALLAAVALVLLLACVNVANLLVGRELGRRGQMAVRAALGATRGRLVRQTLLETLVFAGLGVVTGLALGAASLRVLLALRPPGLLRFDAVGLDPQVLAFTAGTGLLSAVVVAAVGIQGAARVDLAPLLRSAGRGGDDSPRRRLRRLLVVSEVALGAVLLVGAGLLVRSATALGRVDPGFEPENALTFRIALPRTRYVSAESGAAFARRLEESLRSLPGVRALGSVSALPFDSLPNWSTPYTFDGVSEESRGGREADARAIGPGYLAAVGAELIAGRDFGDDDGPERAPVVIVDDRLAARAWSGRQPLGRRLQVEFLDPQREFVPTWATVVGVVRHVRHRRLSEVVREQVYVPQRQSPRQPHAYVMRTAGEPTALVAAVRREVAALDSELPVYDVRPLAAYVGDSLAASRFAMRLAGAFAALALAVAAIGVYGVVSYSVARRRREIGVRLALGAARRDVLRGVLGEGLWLAALGLGSGLVTAALVTSGTRGLLFGITPSDPATYAAVATVLATTALLASTLPGLRASRTDPVEVLRSE